MKPRIGITYSSEISVEPYANAISASGGEPVLLAPDSDVAANHLNGLLLSGGVDVNPELYGQAPAAETERPNDARDGLERKLLAEALDNNLPVLAICRGMQLMNVARGGSLTQHMTGHEMRPPDKSRPAHFIAIDPESNLGQLLFAESLPVNSRHHQAVDRVGKGLQVAARAADGTIEALEIPGKRFVVGVQWHPEDMAVGDTVHRRLFDAFVSAAAQRY